MIQFPIKHRLTGAVNFTAEIDCAEDAPLSMKLGLSVKWGLKNRANLTEADLTEADLTEADLTRANLTRANLTGANLTRANLTRANLTEANLTEADRPFKTDFIAEVLKLPNELEALRQTIIDGKIDGSTYSGECACLAGTLAKQCGTTEGKNIPVNGFQFVADAYSPRERWFMMIKPGHTPENNRAAKEALAWLDEAIAIRDHIRKIAA